MSLVGRWQTRFEQFLFVDLLSTRASSSAIRDPLLAIKVSLMMLGFHQRVLRCCHQLHGPTPSSVRRPTTSIMLAKVSLLTAFRWSSRDWQEKLSGQNHHNNRWKQHNSTPPPPPARQSTTKRTTNKITRQTINTINNQQTTNKQQTTTNNNKRTTNNNHKQNNKQ